MKYSRPLLLLTLLSSVCSTSFENNEGEFLWGAATAAYQIEGGAQEDGRGECIWDAFARIPGKIANGDTGDVAADSYHKYKEDVALLKRMHLNSYRFSISWTRILPTGRVRGGINQKGIDYYNSLIDELVEHGIQPLVTLYHWDLPESLHRDYGGWLSQDIVKDFSDYASICFREFGDRVKMWATLNEPWSFTYMGYGVGSFAPGRCSDRSRCAEGDSSTEPYIAAHNALLAHAATVDLYRKQYKESHMGRIGIVINHDFGWGMSANSAEDQEAAERHNVFQSAWFGDPITVGDYPEMMRQMVGDRLPEFTSEQKQLLLGSFDFLGLNHYTTRFYTMIDSPESDLAKSMNGGSRQLFDSAGDKGSGWLADQRVIETQRDAHGDRAGAQGASPWLQAVPSGFRDTLLWISHRYTTSAGPPIIYVTENGCDVPGESEKGMVDLLRDEWRIDYYASYLRAMQEARELGVDVRGYFAWSLLDNFEWADGYDYRFGLVYVDYDSPERTRTPKESSRWYADYVKSQRTLPYFETINGRRYRRSSSREGGWRRFLQSAMDFSGMLPTIAEL